MSFEKTVPCSPHWFLGVHWHTLLLLLKAQAGPDTGYTLLSSCMQEGGAGRGVALVLSNLGQPFRLPSNLHEHIGPERGEETGRATIPDIGRQGYQCPRTQIFSLSVPSTRSPKSRLTPVLSLKSVERILSCHFWVLVLQASSANGNLCLSTMCCLAPWVCTPFCLFKAHLALDLGPTQITWDDLIKP